jgi:hypothetical protein
MRKTLILLVALAVIGTAAFADAPTFSGEYTWKGNWNADASTAGAVRERVNFDLKVDKFNELNVQFRFENLPTSLQTAIYTTKATATTNEYYATPISAYLGNTLQNFKLITDSGGALGLPVGVKLTTGYFDTYFTNWTYYSQSGYEFYYTGAVGWNNKLVYLGQQVAGAAQLDIAAGPVNVHYVQGLDFKNTLIGADASFAGIGVYLAYGAYAVGNNGFGKGDLSVELSYGLPEMAGFKASVAPYFRYGLADSSYTYGLSLGADYSIVHFAAGLQGDNVKALNNIVADLYVKPIDGLKAGASVYMSQALTTPGLEGVDINASYAFGAAKVVLGYVVAGTDKSAISIFGDELSVADGLYLVVNLGF